MGIGELMNYLSVCSGVEAATVAWHNLGWNPVAFSEIEKFPSEVLAHHYPDVPNLGDMSNYKEWNFGEKTIDLLVGGTPCQSFSVAGLRKGLEDPRGNLALIYVGILDKFRPKWFIWENVPGVLSSSKGRDFGSFLGAVGELGYGFSYRVLDAQNFGVPQRRRRVFVVGHLGDWRPAAEVLFEPESLSRHIEESRKKRKDTPRDTTLGIDTSGRKKMTPLLHQDQVGTLCARDYKGLSSDHVDTKAIVEVFENHPSDSRVKEMGDTCHSVTARWGTGGGNIPFVLGGQHPNAAVAENQSPTLTNAMGSGGGHVPVLNNPIALQDTRAINKSQNGKGWNDTNKSYTLDTKATQGVAYSIREDATKNNMSVTELDVSNCLSSHQPSIMSHHAQTFVMDKAVAHTFKIRCGCDGGGKGYLGQDEKTYTLSTNQDQHLFNNMAVRKLTPIECEKLQGFKPNYTNIKENCPDGPRYKAMGNSMAVPVMKWIGERINNL